MIQGRKMGLRILSLVLCAVSLFLLAEPVLAAPADDANVTLTTVVRNDAHSKATVIGQMENGTRVTLLGGYGSYYKVDCYDMTGYIAKSQIIHKEDGKSYVNCDRASSETRQMEYAGYADALQLRHSLLELAKKQLGYPYVYGGTRPGGFDCSGLMYYLYGKHDISLHRTASQQLQDGIVVAKEGMQVGDLVFFRESWETYPASHVGIYAGNNQIIHAGHEGIVYADLDFDYFDKYYLCARRIVNTGSVQLETEVALATARGILPRAGITGRRAG